MLYGTYCDSLLDCVCARSVMESDKALYICFPLSLSIFFPTATYDERIAGYLREAKKKKRF